MVFDLQGIKKNKQRYHQGYKTNKKTYGHAVIEDSKNTNMKSHGSDCFDNFACFI